MFVVFTKYHSFVSFSNAARNIPTNFCCVYIQKYSIQQFLSFNFWLKFLPKCKSMVWNLLGISLNLVKNDMHENWEKMILIHHNFFLTCWWLHENCLIDDNLNGAVWWVVMQISNMFISSGCLFFLLYSFKHGFENWNEISTDIRMRLQSSAPIIFGSASLNFNTARLCFFPTSAQ